MPADCRKPISFSSNLDSTCHEPAPPFIDDTQFFAESNSCSTIREFVSKCCERNGTVAYFKSEIFLTKKVLIKEINYCIYFYQFLTFPFHLPNLFS